MLRLKTGKLFLAAMVVVCLSVVGSAGIAKPSKTQLKSKLGTVEKKKQALQHEIHAKKIEAKNVTGQLSAVEIRLEQKQSSLSKNKITLMNANADLARTIARLDRTRKELGRRQGLLERRVVDIYEGDDIQYVNVVLGSTNMWTFLSRAYYLQAILDADTQLISRIQSDKRQIEMDKKRQVARVAQIQSLQTQLENERNEVASLVETKASQLDQIENSKELLEQVLSELEAQSRRIESEIRAYQSTPKGKIMAARVFHGGLMMPVSAPITSSFGYRTHPITGVYKLHTGVDLGARYGTQIHCAADGVVIKAGWYGAYGNAVIVDHGGGVQTLYGHCSKLLCSSGQSVKRGQVIGNVGSTGYSTGAHLHFEKRVNGSPVNPL